MTGKGKADAEEATQDSYENGETIDSPLVNAWVVGVEIVEGTGPPQPEIEPPAKSKTAAG